MTDPAHVGAPPSHLRSFALYVVAGVASVATHYAVTVAAVEGFGMRALLATSIGFLAGAVTKYFLNYFLAFRSAAPHAIAVPRFALMLATLFLANGAIFWMLHERAGLHYMVAQVITTGLLVPVGYAVNRIWVFR